MHLPLSLFAAGSLCFFANGVDDIDRVKIRIDDPATDFTIDFWMKGVASQNQAVAVPCGANIKSIGLIIGGADADTFTIINQGSNALTVKLEGDLEDGYNDNGDQAFFTGSFMEAATQPHVETVYGP